MSEQRAGGTEPRQPDRAGRQGEEPAPEDSGGRSRAQRGIALGKEGHGGVLLPSEPAGDDDSESPGH